MAENGRPPVGRALGERVRQARGVDVAVGRKVGGGEHAVGPCEREQLDRALRRDDLDRHTDALGDPAHVLELVQPVARRADADAAAAVEVDRQPRFLLERLVQLERRP